VTFKYPSIPDPGTSTDTMRATLLALRDVVRLLVKNAQVSTDNTGYATTAYVGEQINSALAKINSGALATTALSAQVTSVGGQTTTLSATSATQSTQIGSLTTQLTSVQAYLGSAYTLGGSIVGGKFQPSTVGTLGSSKPLAIPASLITGTITTAQIAAGAVTNAVAASSSLGSSATVLMSLNAPSSVLVIAAFIGPQVASPGGTGQVIVNDGVTDHSVIAIPVATNALPVSGAILLTGVPNGTMLTVKAKFTTGPTYLNGVSIVAIGLQR
jgi:hypothetical protein